MIIHRDIDSVWINTSNGITVYFHYNHMIGKMTAYVRTVCGVSQHEEFGECKSIQDGRDKIKSLTQKDADEIFDKIKNWESNKNYPFEGFKNISYTEPILKTEIISIDNAEYRKLTKQLYPKTKKK